MTQVYLLVCLMNLQGVVARVEHKVTPEFFETIRYHESIGYPERYQERVCKEWSQGEYRASWTEKREYTQL
jgi:hypothetical protein